MERDEDAGPGPGAKSLGEQHAAAHEDARDQKAERGLDEQAMNGKHDAASSHARRGARYPDGRTVRVLGIKPPAPHVGAREVSTEGAPGIWVELAPDAPVAVSLVDSERHGCATRLGPGKVGRSVLGVQA